MAYHSRSETLSALRRIASVCQMLVQYCQAWNHAPQAGRGLVAWAGWAPTARAPAATAPMTRPRDRRRTARIATPFRSAEGATLSRAGGRGNGWPALNFAKAQGGAPIAAPAARAGWFADAHDPRRRRQHLHARRHRHRRADPRRRAGHTRRAEHVHAGGRGAGRGFLFSDSLHGRVRMVGPDGVIRTVAGGGFSEDDDVPARDARLEDPGPLAALPGGGFVVEDNGVRVRRVGPDGRI